MKVSEFVVKMLNDNGINKMFGYIGGFDADIIDMIVDLPTLGSPTSPTSASNFNSTFTFLYSPGSPFSENFGAGLS